jgi:hypothetical protein
MASPRGKNFGAPMTLVNMRQNGVHAVIARCEAVEVSVSILDQMTDDEQKMLLAALQALKGD